MTLFPAEMESERLRYEVVHPDRTDPLEMYEAASHRADRIDEATRYLTWDPHETPNDSLGFVQHAGGQYDDGEAAHYVLRPKADEDGAGEFAGTAALEVDWDRRLGTLGIWLRPRFWGRGYSGERAARYLELAFDRLDLAYVVVEHDADNEKSRRAIERYVERFGGQRDGQLRNGGVRQDGTVYDSVRYSIGREEWAAARE
ncbi:GNAT family N-acetyltransferase [Halorarius halobius]|uniref:GNAT family N-acetyltransferase n=1 Tax=Halorarius halobius TaxID=2962671 RepID=UPI0020CC2917|nr:GNAT family protein [Halorarius halobius]